MNGGASAALARRSQVLGGWAVPGVEAGSP